MRYIRPPVRWDIDEIFRRSQPEPNTGCWLWTGSARQSGRGDVRLPNPSRSIGAHRLAYELTKGPVPSGLEVCHLCDTPACVNPDHLVAGTHQFNMAMSFARRRSHSPTAGKAHCKYGHALSGDNVRFGTRGKYTIRICLACRAAIDKSRRAARASQQHGQGSV